MLVPPDEPDAGEVRIMAASDGRSGSSGTDGVTRALLLEMLRGRLTPADAATQAGVSAGDLGAARGALLAAKAARCVREDAAAPDLLGVGNHGA